MIKAICTLAATVSMPVIVYYGARYIAIVSDKRSPKVNIKLDKDVSSIVAVFLADIPYKFRDEIVPNKDKLNIAAIHHPAVAQFVTIDMLKEALKYPSLSYSHFGAAVNNPYLKDIIYKLAFEDKDPIITHRSGFLTHSNDPKLISAFLSLHMYDYLCSSRNPEILAIIERNLQRADWADLSENSAAIHILERNLDKVNWYTICYNKAAGHIIAANQHSLKTECWPLISRNQSNINLLRANIDKLDWVELSFNPAAIDILCENIARINWPALSMNPAAIELLTANQHNIDWLALSGNPAASSLLRANLDRVNWDALSLNDGAADILRENPDRVNWRNIVFNKSISIEFLRVNIHRLDISRLNYAIPDNQHLAELIFEVDHAEYKKIKAEMTGLITNINMNDI